MLRAYGTMTDGELPVCMPPSSLARALFLFLSYIGLLHLLLAFYKLVSASCSVP
jgi:hypothetical protein